MTINITKPDLANFKKNANGFKTALQYRDTQQHNITKWVLIKMVQIYGIYKALSLNKKSETVLYI